MELIDEEVLGGCFELLGGWLIRGFQSERKLQCWELGKANAVNAKQAEKELFFLGGPWALIPVLKGAFITTICKDRLLEMFKIGFGQTPKKTVACCFPE